MENPGIGVKTMFPIIFKTHISQVASLISKWLFDIYQDIPKWPFVKNISKWPSWEANLSKGHSECSGW